MKKKPIDCLEMKRRIQEKIYEETKDLSPDDVVAYFRRHAQSGPFAALWRKPIRGAVKHSATRPPPTGEGENQPDRRAGS